MATTLPMHGRAIHVDGKLMFQRYDETDHSNHINSISREYLTRILLRKASQHANVLVLCNKLLTHIDKHGVLHFVNTDTAAGGSYNDCSPGTFQLSQPDLVIGCDGAYSAVREAMMRLQTTNFERRYISHSYKELTIRADPKSNDYQLKPPHALHIWPRGEFMMIALPNLDRSFTCTVFAPTKELEATSTDDAAIEEYFAQNFAEVTQYMPDYVEQFKSNPSCRLVMSKVDPWHTKVNGKTHVVLLGDAAHPMVPFYGQGMNAGMEDALELSETLDRHGLDLDAAIAAFVESRMPRGNAIADLSLRNYVEMRSHTASRLFLLRKKIEGYINWLFPSAWVPIYKMVSFTRIPYDEAVRREARQDLILRAATTGVLSLGALALAAGGYFVAQHRPLGLLASHPWTRRS
mmetsp:Transcript_19483/g.49180  ORF Transcript_19483/g.49180 Transcript_19483/m.49180 type:complete len:406 (+) Transcript_19483:1-1218(+)